MRYTSKYVAAIAIAIIFAPVSTRASLVLPVNIEAMVEKADVAFTGECIEAETMVIHPDAVKDGLLVTSYTFEVAPDGVLKGVVPEKFTFKQWGATKEQADAYGAPYPVGIPHYQKGNTYTLFLTAETPLGLRAPVGLGQGNFNIVAGAGKAKMIVNDYGNRSLFKDISSSAKMTKALSAAGMTKAKLPEGPVDYDAFKELVKGLQGGHE